LRFEPAVEAAGDFPSSIFDFRFVIFDLMATTTLPGPPRQQRFTGGFQDVSQHAVRLPWLFNRKSKI